MSVISTAFDNTLDKKILKGKLKVLPIIPSSRLPHTKKPKVGRRVK